MRFTTCLSFAAQLRLPPSLALKGRETCLINAVAVQVSTGRHSCGQPTNQELSVYGETPRRRAGFQLNCSHEMARDLEDVMVNETETQRFNEAYRKFERGDRAGALAELRELSRVITDPWYKTALLYHEALFLVEMNDVSTAKQCLDAFKEAFGSLGGAPSDGCQDDLPHNLAVMAGYTEMRVLLAEKREAEALEVVEKLLSRSPQQLSIEGFREISDEIKTHHGMLLADCGRWKEARPLLETASPPENWKGTLSYYLGHCYYESQEYKRAESKLKEALNSGLACNWEEKARYVLGLVEYHLGNIGAANQQFKLSMQLANPAHPWGEKIWEWLEETSRALGGYDEADQYRKRRLLDSTVN